ncbi:MAG: Ig-like domain-containing protein, partial [Clostridiales bacterium]|nr:Ig-like domain-containing protein [Clostridiales bacterium]
AGTYTAHVTVTRDNYVTVEQDVEVSIALATQSVTIDSIASVVYDGKTFQMMVAADDDATVTVTYTDADGNTVETPVNAGTYTAHVTVTQDNYATVEQVVVFTIDQAAQDISYETTSVTVTEGDGSFTIPLTLTAVDGEITYTSSDESVATVDANGKVTIVGAGTATITATVAATDNYTEATASYTLTVEAAEEEAQAAEEEAQAAEEAEEATEEEVVNDDDSDDGSSSSGSSTTSGSSGSSSTSNSSSTTTSPKTGDESKVVLWLTLVITASFGLLATAIYSRRKNKEQ